MIHARRSGAFSWVQEVAQKKQQQLKCLQRNCSNCKFWSTSAPEKANAQLLFQAVGVKRTYKADERKRECASKNLEPPLKKEAIADRQYQKRGLWDAVIDVTLPSHWLLSCKNTKFCRLFDSNFSSFLNDTDQKCANQILCIKPRLKRRLVQTPSKLRKKIL